MFRNYDKTLYELYCDSAVSASLLFPAVGPYFTAVELADFARDLDDDERMRMAEGGLDSPQYLRY